MRMRALAVVLLCLPSLLFAIPQAKDHGPGEHTVKYGVVSPNDAQRSVHPGYMENKPSHSGWNDNMLFPKDLSEIELVLVTDITEQPVRKIIKANIVQFIKYYNRLGGGSPKMVWGGFYNTPAGTNHIDDAYQRIVDQYNYPAIVHVESNDNTLNFYGAIGVGSPAYTEGTVTTAAGQTSIIKWIGAWMVIHSDYLTLKWDTDELKENALYLLLHELGHGFGLEHTAILEDVMNYHNLGESRYDHLQKKIEENWSHMVDFTLTKNTFKNFLTRKQHVYLSTVEHSTVSLDDTNVVWPFSTATLFNTTLKGFKDNTVNSDKRRDLQIRVDFYAGKWRPLAIYRLFEEKPFWSTDDYKYFNISQIDIGKDLKNRLTNIYKKQIEKHFHDEEGPEVTVDGKVQKGKRLLIRVTVSGYLSPDSANPETITRELLVFDSDYYADDSDALTASVAYK